MEKNMIMVSVITVCYNAENVIEKTLLSVLEQTYGGFEYIIKDGQSKDKTNEIIETYRKKFEQRGIVFKHIIEKDFGIYDAMNQAVAQAKGLYVNFMNADDIYFNKNVLNDIFTKKIQDADIIYGDSICEYEFVRDKKEYVVWKGNSIDFRQMPFCHQACFIKTEVMCSFAFDTTYKSAGDYHSLCRFYKAGKKFVNSEHTISVCTMDGVSNMKMMASYLETLRVKKELGLDELLRADTKMRLFSIYIKQWILSNLPHAIVGRLLRISIKSNHKVYDSIEMAVNGETNGGLK